MNASPRASFDLRLIETTAGMLSCVVRPPYYGTQLLIVPPLFEEMNRTRRLLALVGQRLSAHGIGSWLPDLPGTGDSALPTAAACWTQWRATIAELAASIATETGDRPHLLAVRGGALLGDAAGGRSVYLLAPVESGARLLRELFRARLAAERERGSDLSVSELERALAAGETVELAGYAISPEMANALASASMADWVSPVRKAGLNEAATVDVVLQGPPVWRQTEPAAADALAETLAFDIAAWVRGCDVR